MVAQVGFVVLLVVCSYIDGERSVLDGLSFEDEEVKVSQEFYEACIEGAPEEL